MRRELGSDIAHPGKVIPINDSVLALAEKEAAEVDQIVAAAVRIANHLGVHVAPGAALIDAIHAVEHRVLLTLVELDELRKE